VTIVVAMGSAIAALAAAYKHARDEEMKAERGKTELLQKVQKPITEMMERAIEAFTLARTSNDQATQKYEQMISEQKDLERSSREIREELRRVAEKVDEIKHQR
jgi:DNA-binding ferritin-like protein